MTASNSHDTVMIEFTNRANMFDAWYNKVATYMKSRLHVVETTNGDKHVYLRLDDVEVTGVHTLMSGVRNNKLTPLIVLHGLGESFPEIVELDSRFSKLEYGWLTHWAKEMEESWEPTSIAAESTPAPAPTTPVTPATTSNKDPGPLPEALLSCPGFIDKMIQHTMATAPYPNKVLAFCGALAMLAHLSGRNFTDRRGIRTNIYILGLAESGVGKDHPRKMNINLARELGLMPTMADRFASAEGLEDTLLLKPASFFQTDEFDTLLAALNQHDGPAERVYAALLQFYTSSDTVYAMRKKALSSTNAKPNPFDKIRAKGIRDPHLVLLGNSLPVYTYQAISERSFTNGLLSRTLVFEAGKRGKAGNPHVEPFSDELMTYAQELVNRGGFEGLDLEDLENTADKYNPPMVVPETEEATARRDEIVEACEDLYNAADDDASRALWTRGAEKVQKLALLRAISINPKSPQILPEDFDWAWKIVEHVTRRTLYMGSMYMHDNEFDALRLRCIRHLTKHGGEMKGGKLLKAMHIDANTFEKIIDTLVKSEMVVETPIKSGGVIYKLV